MKNIIRIMIAGLAATIMMMGVPAPAEANPISDAGSAIWHTAGSGAAMITGAINTGIETITDLINEACNFATHNACEWLMNQTHATLEAILDGCKHFDACDWLLKQPTKLIEPAARWMSNHPEDAALIQLGLMVLIPLGTQAIIAKATVPEFISGIGTEAIAGTLATDTIEEIAMPGIQQTIREKLAEALANGEETFSLCEEKGCTLPDELREPRRNFTPKEQEDLTKELLDRQGGTSATGEPIEPGTKTEIDHKLPLSCGGTNDISNLQILTQTENRSKGSFGSCTKIPTDILG